MVRPSDEERKAAGARLRAAREAMGLTQVEAAERAEVPQSRFSEWERGDRIPSWPTLVKIAATLKLDPAVLLPELCPAGSALTSLDAFQYNAPESDWEAFERLAIFFLRARGYEVRRK